MSDDTIKFEGRDWALVTAASGKRYVGRVEGMFKAGLDPIYKDDDQPPSVMLLNPAYEVHTATRPVRIGPEEMALHRETLIFPLDTCCEDTKVRLFHPSEVVYAQDLTAGSRRMYVDLVEMCRRGMTEARARKSGLSLAGGPMPGPVPGGLMSRVP